MQHALDGDIQPLKSLRNLNGDIVPEIRCDIFIAIVATS